ncbi:unnamed protein product, partial [Rotaria socialis]
MQERESNETILCDISIETGFQPTTSSTQKPEMTMSDFEREPLEENETSISPEDHSLNDFIYFDTSNIGTSIAQRKEYCASVGLPKNLADNKQLIKVLKDLNAKIRQKFNDEYCDIISNLKISNTRLAQTNEQLRDDLLNTKTYLQQISMLNQILLKKEQVNNDYAFAKELDEDGKTAAQCHNSFSQFGETTSEETWLDEQTPDSFVNIEGYKLYRKDYIHSKIGGVAIYVRNELTSNEVHFDINAPIDMEAIFVKVQYCKNPSILISSMYRHPHGKKDTYDFIETALNKMLKQNVQFYVLGDLNDNQIKSVNPKSPLKAIMYKNGLHQLIETPTRVTSSTTSLIDVIITNKRDGVTWENSECSIADHNIITVIANMKKPKRNPITCTFRCMKNYSKEHFCAVLSENIGALNNIYNTDNVDEQVRIFTKVFQESLEKCAPIVTRNLKRPPAPWLTEEVRTKMSERDHLLRIFRQNVSEIAAQRAYQNSKKEVKRLVKKAKKQHYQSRLKDNKGNLKAIWKIVNEIIPRKSQNHDPSSGLPDMQKIANDFNAFFSSIGKNTYNEVKKSDMDKNKNCDKENFKHCTKLPKINSLNNLFRPKPITPQGLIVIINNLHNTNSVGHDGIALKYLKDSSNIMYKYLLTIINTSINTGVCPKQWKEAIVKPLHKNGDSSLPSNFRPISLLPILSKILEKAVADQLIMYLESNNLISNCQYGYRHHLSTELALLKITEEVYKAIENKEICLLTLLDLSKAFDTVNPELLLRKLLEINVSTFWFENYLSGRTQSVKLNNTTSHQNVIEFGVPQGSILGPILFLIYINDIVKSLRNCIVVMYADDIQLIHK